MIAAINLSAHASRVSLAAMRAVLLPALLETARQIEADLRSQGVELTIGWFSKLLPPFPRG